MLASVSRILDYRRTRDNEMSFLQFIIIPRMNVHTRLLNDINDEMSIIV